MRSALALALAVTVAACGSRRAETIGGPLATAPEAASEGRVVAAIVRADPHKLIGLERAQLTEFLGAPRFVRRDGPAQMWRYVGESCVLDVFMYGEDGALRARYYDVRSLTTARVSPQACVSLLMSNSRPNTSS